MNKLKETNGKYYQECEVVMLATDDKTAPILSYLNDKSLQYFPNTYWSNGDLSKRHLYFLSNEEIKDGDWFMNRQYMIEEGKEEYAIWKCGDITPNSNPKKIIATTDTLLGLPQPSQSFIKAYIEAYNEDKPISKVLVEMEGIESCGEFTPIIYQLKLNSSNEIIIKKVKDCYTREEVIELLFKCQDEVEYPETYYEPCNEEEENIKEFKNDMEEWIETKLITIMIEQFVTYEIALKLKEFGFEFDVPCIAGFNSNKVLKHTIATVHGGEHDYISISKYDDRLLAPLWQQVIDWFREKHQLNIEIIWLPNVSKYGIVVSDINYIPKLNDGNTNFIHGKDVTNNFVKFDMYEEAREQAILKAIELIKQSY